MSVSPDFAAVLAERVAAIYRDAELAVLRRVAEAIAKGIERPDWAVHSLARIQAARALALADLSRVNGAAALAITEALEEAYRQGALSALQDAGRTAGTAALVSPAQRAAVVATVGELATGITQAEGAILRSMDDVYREVIGRVIADQAAGGTLRRVAAQQALDEFADKGITSIVTQRGRMNLPDYVNMAVRTGTREALMQGHVQQMHSLGLSLVVIQPGPRSCKVCDRWARAVLSTDGTPAGDVVVESATTGRLLTVHVDGTLAEAKDAGFAHPNCRCRLRAWIPGASDPADLERPPYDAKGYAAQQQQRQIESGIRKWKRREALALDPTAATAARQKVREWQKSQRSLLAEHPYLKRQPTREQVGRAF